MATSSQVHASNLGGDACETVAHSLAYKTVGMNLLSTEVATLSARALLDEVHEGVLVCDVDGAVVYANAAAKRELGTDVELSGSRVDEYLPKLEALGARRAPTLAGEALAFLFPVSGSNGAPLTLAERERVAIVDMLERSGGRLAETARKLGISRTTLWRRLRAYGLRPPPGRQ